MISEMDYNKQLKETLEKLEEKETVKAATDTETEIECRKVIITLTIRRVSTEEQTPAGYKAADTVKEHEVNSVGAGLLRKDTGAFYAIGNGVTIGREDSNDIVIAEPEGHYVSAHHAAIKVEDGKMRLTDRLGGSTNGTYINGKKIRNHLIKIGDKIKFANIEFTVIAE